MIMYLDHWRLQKFPFENVSDPDLFYLSHTHEEGLTRLLYATMMRKGAAIGAVIIIMSLVFVPALNSTAEPVDDTEKLFAEITEYRAIEAMDPLPGNP